MATLAANSEREYELTGSELFDDIPVVASDIIYAGAAVGESSGNARPLSGGDNFRGFATRKADNASGSAADINVNVRKRGSVKLTVTGVTSADDVGVSVYASDDDTFTTTASGASAIGKVKRWVSSTTAWVYFEAFDIRSI